MTMMMNLPLGYIAVDITLAGAKSLNLRSLPPPGAAVVALDCLAIGWKRIRKCVNIHPYQPRSVALMAATN